MNDKTQNKTIFVTGGAGYIGSHTCKALAQAEYNPVIFDDLSTGKSENVQWGDHIHGDITNPASVSKAIKETKPAAIIHFAAKTIVPESINNPDLYQMVNVGGTINILNAMKEHGVPHIIFSSSAAVYGLHKNHRVAEDDETLPINPYGQTKLDAEFKIAEFAKNNDIHFAALRYFNAAGCDPDGEIGFPYETGTTLLPVIMRTITGLQDKLIVYGDDYNSPDGTAVRDFIHVSDLAEAHVKALDYLKQDGENIILNVGTGTGHSVKEMIKMTQTITGKDIPVEYAPRRKGDPAISIAIANKIQEELNWAPRYDLHDMIESAWKRCKKAV